MGITILLIKYLKNLSDFFKNSPKICQAWPCLNALENVVGGIELGLAKWYFCGQIFFAPNLFFIFPTLHQYNQPIYNPINYIYNPINRFLYINNHEISRLSRKYEDQSLKYKHFRFCNKSTLTLCLCNALSKLYMKKSLIFLNFFPVSQVCLISWPLKKMVSDYNSMLYVPGVECN